MIKNSRDVLNKLFTNTMDVILNVLFQIIDPFRGVFIERQAYLQKWNT